jgi:hypothetical protein
MQGLDCAVRYPVCGIQDSFFIGVSGMSDSDAKYSLRMTTEKRTSRIVTPPGGLISLHEAEEIMVVPVIVTQEDQFLRVRIKNPTVPLIVSWAAPHQCRFITSVNFSGKNSML